MDLRSAAITFLLAAAILQNAAVGATPARKFAEKLAFTPAPVSTPVDLAAKVDISAGMTPDVSQYWRRNLSLGDATTDNFVQAVGDVLAEAIRQSGLFTHPVLPGSAPAELVVKIRFEIFDARVFKARLSFQIVDPATGQEVSRQAGEMELGPRVSPDGKGIQYTTAQFGHGSIIHILTLATRNALQTLLPPLEAAFADRVQELKAQPAREKAIQDLANLPLPDLLVASDPDLETARGRNRALVAAKIQQLPAILRNDLTEDLTQLLVRLEQTILDLDHESTMANDRAQRLTAGGGSAREIDRLRGLAVSYRERIELLKPIAAAIKDEIANRNR